MQVESVQERRTTLELVFVLPLQVSDSERERATEISGTCLKGGGAFPKHLKMARTFARAFRV